MQDFRLEKSLLLESRMEIAVGHLLRVVARNITKLGIGLHDISNKLTTEGDAKHYEVERKRLLNEEESYRKFREDRGIGYVLQGSADPEPVELVRLDPMELLPPLANVEDEVARLEFLRTTGELMPKAIKEPEDMPGDLFPKVVHGPLAVEEE